MESILDAHVHVYDAEALRLQWVRDVPSLGGVWSPASYESEASPLGIESALYMEVDAPADAQQLELSTIADEMDRPGGMFAAAMVGGDPADPAFGDWLDRLEADTRMVGVRRVLHVDESPQGTCLEPAFVAGVQALGKRGLVFDACVRHGEIDDVVKLARLCPETTIVLDHLGNPPVPQGMDSNWCASIDRCAETPNLIGKLSGLIQHLDDDDWDLETFAPFMSHLLEAFGADRVVWASNWPVCNLHGSLERWVSVTRRFLADYSASERSAVLRANGERVYRIS